MFSIAPNLADVAQSYGCTSYNFEVPWTGCDTGFFHAGIDLWDSANPNSQGQPLYAARDGVIWKLGSDSVVENHDLGPYAVCLYIPADNVYLWYGHCFGTYVHDGDHVTAGQLIAAVGSNGISTGPHLHLEARDSRWPDPTNAQQVVEGSIDPTPYCQVVMTSPPIPNLEDLPVEIAFPALTFEQNGVYDIVDGVNPNMVNAWCNVRNAGKQIATGKIDFVRRSDGIPVATEPFSLAPGAGFELSINNRVTDVGAFVVEFTSGDKLSASPKFGNKS